MKSGIITQTLNKKNTTKIPIWFMRQAGRYLPEYMYLRNECKGRGMGFLDMCYNIDIATQITLQPIKRFDIDAAIIFSDILVIPQALGLKVDFLENQGPILQQINNIDDINLLSYNGTNYLHSKITELIKSIKSDSLGNKELIGFSGCPFTLACYMIEGSGSKDFAKTVRFAYQQKPAFDKLIKILQESIVDYLLTQIEAGVDLIQLFDSHAKIAVDNLLYHKYIIDPNNYIVNKIRQCKPDIPIICFPKGSGYFYQNFSKSVSCHGISIDNSADNNFFTQNINQVLQGNLNNQLLAYGNISDIINQTKSIVNELLIPNKSFIFNLSHGIIKDTNPDNIQVVIQTLRNIN